MFIKVAQLSSIAFFFLATACFAADGKLLATAGLSQVEGASGGGIVPWATISGYETDEEIGVSVFDTLVSVDDYRMNSRGLSIGFQNDYEFSVAKQTFDLKTLGGEIRQTVFGFKKRLSGDLLYSTLPQFSFGLQVKRLEDKAIAQALGAKNTDGIDYYVAASKVHLGAVNGYNLIWNLTARATKANQIGLLGFGGSGQSNYELVLEGSAGILLTKSFAVGIEYRQKPDNLGLKEDDWQDVFVSYLPNKHFSVTLAYASLGRIAGVDNQEGIYFSLNGYF